MKQELSGITPMDGTFSDAMKGTKVSDARLARYLLRSMGLANSGDNEPYFVPNDDEVINLEHVLPKRPDVSWDAWSDEERRAHVSGLDNQALMRASDNSHLKSSAFSDKEDSFAKFPDSLTAQTAQENAWRPEQVNARQEKLAELAPKAWPI